MFSAPWIALDSSVRGLVDWYVGGLSMDALAHGSLSDMANATRDLSAVPNVERVEPVVYFTAEANLSGNPSWYSLLLVQPSFDGIVGRLGFSWPGPPSPGTVVVPEDLQAIGKRAGDPLPLEFRTPVYDANYTIIGWTVKWSNFTISGFYHVLAPGGFSVSPTETAYLSVDDAPALRAAANLTGSDLPAQLYIWLDRGALFNPYDLTGSSARLQREIVLMENALQPWRFYVYYAGSSRGPSLDGIPAAIDSRTLGLRLFFTVFTIPTLALAGLLARVGFDIGVTGRRRELAVLRARGLSVRSVRGVLLLEASLLAVIGGLIGLAVGAVTSRLFLSSALWDLSGSSVPLPIADVAVSLSTALLALLVSWGFALLSTRRLARLLASEDIVGAFKAHSVAEVSIPHRASRDFLMAGVAAAGILLLVATTSMRGSPFGIGFFLLGLSTAILAPVAPFLLTAAVVRYLTRGTTWAYRTISKAFRPVLGELQPLVERNLARVPRRSSNIAMVVTFAVGFVVAIFVANASYAAYREADILRNTPADVVADYYGSGPGGINRLNLLDPTNITRLRAVPGVASVTPVLQKDSSRGTITFFDASNFLQSVRWITAADLGGVDPAGLMRTLAGGTTFAANTLFVNTYGVQPGDPVEFSTYPGSVSLRFTQTVPRIPGLDLSYYGYEYGSNRAYANLSAMPPEVTPDSIYRGEFLIGLAPGADSAFVARQVSDIFGGQVYARTLDAARAAASTDVASVVIFTFLQAQTEIAVVMLVIAVALFVYSASAERRDELATLVARGVGARAVGALVMAEGWVVTILGLILGVVGGLVSAWTALAIAGLLLPAGVTVPFVVPLTVLVPMAGAVLGVAVAGFVGAASIRGMDVVRVLKVRGG